MSYGYIGILVTKNEMMLTKLQKKAQIEKSKKRKEYKDLVKTFYRSNPTNTVKTSEQFLKDFIKWLRSQNNYGLAYFIEKTLSHQRQYVCKIFESMKL